MVQCFQMSMSLPEVSHVRTSQSQADKQALKAKDLDYGTISAVLLAKYDRNTQSWKTCQTCLMALLNNEAAGLARVSETWPRSGLMRNGTAYRLPPLVRRTSGTGFGSLLTHSIPTPTAQDHIERESTSTEKLNPLTNKSVSLDRWVKFWPTPEAGLAKFSGIEMKQANKNKVAAAEAGTRKSKMGSSLSWDKRILEADGELNPAWVEWLMGFPSGWTDLEASETQ